MSHPKELIADAMNILHECRQANLCCIVSGNKEKELLRVLHDKLTDLEIVIESVVDELTDPHDGRGL